MCVLMGEVGLWHVQGCFNKKKYVGIYTAYKITSLNNVMEKEIKKLLIPNI